MPRTYIKKHWHGSSDRTYVKNIKEDTEIISESGQKTVSNYSIIQDLLEYPRCFTYDDILERFEKERAEQSNVLSELNSDQHFLKTSVNLLQDIYISKRILYLWFVRFNTELAKADKFKIRLNTFETFIIEIQPNEQYLSELSISFVEFARQFGLVNYQPKTNRLIFPISFLLSFLSTSSIEEFESCSIDLFDNLCPTFNQKIIIDNIQIVLETLNPREKEVITRRAGLFGNSKMTLEEIGNVFDVTRERIRQIEVKSYRKLNHPSRRRKLTLPLIQYIFQHKGNLIIKTDEIENEMLFLAKVQNIPVSTFPNTDTIVLGLQKDKPPINKDDINGDMDIETISNVIEQKCDIPFTKEDITTLAKNLNEKMPPKHITKSEKVYIALKNIGRPSHFSEITEEYNELFPKEISNEHSIHAILTREENGIVWIGIRGTYALKEWGFERPSLTLFDTVNTIVRKKYEETNQPVPFLTVQAEIGKYRKVINRNSLIIATFLNSDIGIIGKDKLIPKYAASEETINTDEAEKLNNILENFEYKMKEGDIDMEDEMTYDAALATAVEALNAYNRANTKQEVEEIFIKYGKNGIGYRSLCRMFFSQKTPEEVIQIRTKKESA